MYVHLLLRAAKQNGTVLTVENRDCSLIAFSSVSKNFQMLLQKKYSRLLPRCPKLQSFSHRKFPYKNELLLLPKFPRLPQRKTQSSPQNLHHLMRNRGVFILILFQKKMLSRLVIFNEFFLYGPTCKLYIWRADIYIYKILKEILSRLQMLGRLPFASLSF